MRTFNEALNAARAAFSAAKAAGNAVARVPFMDEVARATARAVALRCAEEHDALLRAFGLEVAAEIGATCSAEEAAYAASGTLVPGPTFNAWADLGAISTQISNMTYNLGL